MTAVCIGVLILAVAPAGAAPRPAANKPAVKNGGNLVILQDNLSFNSTDPDQASGSVISYLNPTLLTYQTLLTLSPTGALEPLLATHWAYNKAQTALTLTLRKGVKFQDGTPFNAQAVVFNLERVANPASNSNCVPFFSAVASMDAVGQYTVVFHFKGRYSALLNILAGEPCTFIASPTAIQKEGSTFGLNPVGTSPFKFESEVPGSYIKFVRWNGSWQKAHLASVTAETTGSDNSAIAAIETNTAQVLTGANLADTSLIVGVPNLHAVRTPESAVYFIRLLDDKPPFNNIEARRAVAQGLNLSLLTKTLYGREGSPDESLESPVSFAFKGFKVPGYPQYNPAAAAADVRALPGGKLNFTLNVINTTAWEVIAEGIQSELQQIPGITVQLNPLTTTAALAAQHGETYQATMANGPVLPDPDFTYYRNFDSSSSQNQDGYSDPAFDSIVEGARQTFSEPQRRQLYLEAQEMLAKSVAVAPLFAVDNLYIINSHVHNFPPIDESGATDLSQVWLS